MNTMMIKMLVKFQNLMNREEGQNLVEYGLVVALISVAAIASISSIGTKVSSILASANTAL